MMGCYVVIQQKFFYYSSGLFEKICFQCGKVPEDECDESDRVKVNEEYYYYCDECYMTSIKIVC